MRVGSILFEYTGGAELVRGSGATVAELFADLETRHKGLAFRVLDEQGGLRPHIALFLDRRACRDANEVLDGVERVHVLGALSGG
ncbi:hypothetical protein Pla86_48560 [Planctomycetes bacterium Pla86]|uniref:ThiS family protein n=1 Tax=Engelhardtia mirabilis TaxID=2528011 RepID=A0A518BRZ5_9BACT|nr:hypothetical protein Pla133_48580 [Planctomycetes bacterium Pla133]QDV04062.1 hypothetical protein Pla86_48560 [Planctomycetes bacterium Pla86]